MVCQMHMHNTGNMVDTWQYSWYNAFWNGKTLIGGNTMNLQNTYLLTADFIEQYPNRYDFQADRIPECGSPGCIIGTAGLVQGLKAEGHVHNDCLRIFGMAHETLYHKMSEARELLGKAGNNQISTWTGDAKTAVKCLRFLASELPVEPEHNFAQEQYELVCNMAVIPDEEEERV